MRRAHNLLVQANTTFRYEGFVPLVKRLLVFLSQPFFRYGTYYMFEYAVENIDGLSEADYMPRITGFTFYVASTEEHAHELEAAGVDWQMWSSNTQERLASGAMAFCIVVGQEPASMMWVGINETAKTCMGERPFEVDFSNGEYCTSQWTHPKYRGLGLAKYTTFRALQILRDMGMTRNRGAVLKRNSASVKASALWGGAKYAEARYLKLLWWEFWKEKLIDSEKGA